MAQLHSHPTKRDHELLLRAASRSEVFRFAVQGAFNHIVITDIDGIIVYANSAVERITGYPPEEVIGKRPNLWGNHMPQAFYKKMWHTIKELELPFTGEINNRRKNGEDYVAKAVISPIHDEKNHLIGFLGTEEDITKQKELERMKTEFVNLTAHQLRTPLTAIQWNTEALLEKGANKKQQKEAAQAIASISHHLMVLVNVLLNIARIESGRMSVKPEDVHLSEMLDWVITNAKGAAMKRQIQVLVENHLTDDQLKADPDHLTEIFVNLLSNAIKYSPRGSTVRIVLNGDKSRVQVSVIDEGCGIPKSEQSRIFEKFFRASNVGETEGNGLGLYFVRLLVNTDRGKLSFKSTAGKGTTFVVDLPRRGPKKQQGEARISHEKLD